MKKFVLESGHSSQECVRAIEEIAKKGGLKNFVFGCKHGEHIGWAYIKADDKETVLDMVPDFIRGRALAYEVDKITD